ncbi:hypothetical protein QWY81_08045 [Polaribacter undariae]|uniref:Uncharacterized protein n=1 Tax=Polaribacter sejongensis TaxID=985043 RepID=A0AAJ1QWR5_9FLAO|nr:hypothetical protein [Polaribacter undariae]MDN3619400.1 hypothetical protein [Polaribacter undariae]UWD33400.1 hypothetical protein NQP51_06920 [Polaribacter undariae]
MKIDSHRLEINETCNPEYIEAIKKYWVLENNKFINKSTVLGKPFGFSAYEFGNMVKAESKLFIEVKCDTCPNIESKQVKSQSNFITIKSNLCDTKTRLVNCAKCKAKIETQKLEELEIQNEIRIEKQKFAIKNQTWLNLTPFQLNALHCIIQNKGISKLFTKFNNTPNNNIWSAIYTLRNLNLIVLHYKEDNSHVIRTSFLPELESLLPTVNRLVKSKPKATYNSTSKELKIKLTKNNNVKNRDSPIYSGVLNFEEDVHIEKGTQYTFGVWKLEFDNLYFTLIPTDSIYKAPSQQSTSSQPKHLKDAIQDFFNSSKFDF